MLSKKERDELNMLSMLAYSSKSRWQKMLEAGQLDVPVSVEETSGDKYFGIQHIVKDRLTNKSQPKHTIIKAETALKMGLTTQEKIDEIKTHKTITRKPTFGEIKEGLEAGLRMKTILLADEITRMTIAAHEFLLDKLPGKFKLVVDPVQQGLVDEQIGQITNEVHKETIKKAFETEDGAKFDAVSFLDAYLDLQGMTPEEAQAQYDGIFLSAKAGFIEDLKSKRLL